MKSEKLSEEDLKRIEKKVDLLYKYMFELGEENDIPIAFRGFLDEIIPLFKLSVKKEEFIKIEGRPQDIIKRELENLENSFNQGNYLAKDKKKIQIKIDDLKGILEFICNFCNYRNIKLTKDYGHFTDLYKKRKKYQHLQGYYYHHY